MPPIYVQVDLGDGATRVHAYSDDSVNVCVQDPATQLHSAKPASELVVGDYLCTYPPSSPYRSEGFQVAYVGATHPDEE